MNRNYRLQMKKGISATQQGESQVAYQIFQQVSKTYPDQAEAWIWRGMTSEDSQEKLDCLGKALQINPDDRKARQHFYNTLREKIGEDGFLQYSRESDYLYFVHDTENRSLVIHKERSAPQSYPPIKPSNISPVYRWLIYGLIAIPFGGLFTIVCSLFSLYLALRVSREFRTQKDLKRLFISIVFAFLLLGVGIIISALFWIHL